MNISNNGIEVEKHYESLHDGNLSKLGLQPKRDPVGIWTVLYGHALIHPVTGKWIKDFKDVEKYYPQFLNVTDETIADTILREDNKSIENFLNKSGVALLQHQFDALCDFAFNEGVNNLKVSTLWKVIKAGGSSTAITNEFMRWNKGDVNGDGKLEILPGLTFRRKTDATLFNNNQLVFYNV